MSLRFYSRLIFILLILFPAFVYAASTSEEKHSAKPHHKIQQHSASEKSQTAIPVIEQKQQQQRKISSFPLGLMLYRPTYILPFYYTQSPYTAVYRGNTPLDQDVKSSEFKAQLSFQVPLMQTIFNDPNSSLNIAYTQLSYWQFYTESQYFRETDYEPELFLSKKIGDNQQIDLGINHQSNGRGGELERSWNRAYINYAVSGNNWLINIKPWLPIFEAQSSNLHNPDIYKYMGYGWVIGAFKFHHQTISLMLRNQLESRFSRGAEELDWSFPIHKRVHLFVQIFSGYGQSLIEYNHYTNAIGIGFALNNWL